MMSNTFNRLFQLGRVTVVDEAKLKARVLFPDSGMTSDWLTVLQHKGTKITVKPDGAHSHSCPEGSTSTDGVHEHKETISTTWMPVINDMVLVAYLPYKDSAGFILGVTHG